MKLRLIRLVGKGAFSSVWLARDEENVLLESPPQHDFDISDATQASSIVGGGEDVEGTMEGNKDRGRTQQPHERRRPSEIGIGEGSSTNGARRGRDRKVDGLRPFNMSKSLSFSVQSGESSSRPEMRRPVTSLETGRAGMRRSDLTPREESLATLRSPEDATPRGEIPSSIYSIGTPEEDTYDGSALADDDGDDDGMDVDADVYIYGKPRDRKEAQSRLVAVKMMDIAMCDANDRTRISFVREVEVLRVSLLRWHRGLS